jgi:ATP-dependent RNA helicase RhlE
LFSATFSKEIRQLAADLLNSPVEIAAAPRNTAAERVKQAVYPVDKARKRELLSHRIGAENWRQVLVFTRTKHGANRLAEQLDRAGIPAMPIHGNKSQNARVRALEDFKANRVVALVATEVAARGLDIKELPYVVNYELPNVPEDYVHRIGRTARAGSTGQAISLVSPDEASYLRDIVKLLGRDIPALPLPAFAVTEAAPAPQQQRQADRPQPARPQAQRQGRPGQPQRHQARPRQNQRGRSARSA